MTKLGASPRVRTLDAAPDAADWLPVRYRAGWRAGIFAALAFAAVAAVVLFRLATSMAEPGVTSGAGGDFRDATYYPVKALLDGVNPYDPTAFLGYHPDIGQWFPLYGPLHLALHLPLAALPFEAALWLYAGLMLTLTVALAWVALELTGFGRPAAVVLGASTLLLASNAGRANLINLQPTIVIVLGIYLALAARRQPWLAAVGVALAFIKPQFGIPLTALLLVTGRAGVAWRGLILAVGTAIPVLIRLVAIEGGLAGVVDSVRNNLRFAADEPISDYQIDLTGSFDLGSTALAFGVAAVLVLATRVALRGSPPESSAEGLTLFSVAIVLGLFHVNYDLLLLTWPALLAVRGVLTGARPQLHRALLVLLLLLFFNPLTASFVIDQAPISDVLGALTALTLLATFIVAARLHRSNATGFD